MTWTLLSNLVKQFGNLAAGMVLARLLGPGAYGLVGMVVIFTGFGALFVDLGLSAGLIQRKQLTEGHIEAAFWVNVTAASALALLLCLVAPLIATFYSQPQLLALARVSSLAFILGGLGAVQAALLSREMRFRALAATDITATIASYGLGISMAFCGFGVWSLVAQTLTQSAVRTGGLWWVSPWRPRLVFKSAAIKDLAGFSGSLFGYNVFNYWVRNADNLLVGRFLGEHALGLYARAYQLMLMPVQQLSSVVGNVMFPALTSVQDDIPRVRAIYLRAIAVLHLIAAPVYAGLFAVADNFVLVVLGDRWVPMVPLLRILCIVGFFQPVGNSTGWLYTALGRTDVMFQWGMVAGVLYIVSFFIGLRWGLLGVTWSYCIASLLSWYPSWAAAGRLAKLSFWNMLAPLMASSSCALASAAAVMVTGTWLGTRLSALPVLGLQVCLGAALYMGLVFGLRLQSGREALEFAAQRFRRPG